MHKDILQVPHVTFIGQFPCSFPHTCDNLACTYARRTFIHHFSLSDSIQPEIGFVRVLGASRHVLR